jgi:hypothetical protein
MLTRRELIVRSLGGVFVAVSCGGAAAPARAHHGFGGRYDTRVAIYLAGTVSRVRIGMPHPVIELRVSLPPVLPTGLPEAAEFEPRLLMRPEDQAQTREVEFPPVARFLELGPEIKPGDRIALIALRNCAAPHQVRGQWIQVASGRVVVRQGRMQNEVEGCTR